MKIQFGIAALSLFALSSAFAAPSLEGTVRPAHGTPYAHGATTDWDTFTGTYRVRVTLAPTSSSDAVAAQQEAVESENDTNDRDCRSRLSFTAGQMKIDLLSEDGHEIGSRVAPLTFSISETEDGECGVLPTTLSGGAVAIAEARDIPLKMANGTEAKLTFFVPVGAQVSIAGGQALVDVQSVHANRADWFSETQADYPDALKVRGTTELRDPSIPLPAEEPFDFDRY